MDHYLSLELGEELEEFKLPVIGTVPSWLQGTLVRNGPVLFAIDGKPVGHWFDGLGMLHAFSLKGGHVSYSNKFLRSEAYKAVFSKGSMNYLGFASDPCHTLFKRIFSYFFDHEVHNANVNITKIAERYLGLTETPLPVEFDLKTLKTLGAFVYEDRLPKSNSFESAHPHLDEKSQTLISYLIKFGVKSSYQLYTIETGSAKRQVFAEIPTKTPSYMHSFALTKNYVLLTEFPFVVNPIDLFLKGKPFIKNYKWIADLNTKILVVNRKTGKVIKKFEASPFFAFHHANAYEKDGEILMDLITYPDASIIETIGKYGREREREQVNHALTLARLMRYHLMLDNDQLQIESLSEIPLEFPRINPSYDGKPYRYLYAADIREPYGMENERPLYKIDVENKTLHSWSENGCFAGEPIFVASPNAIKEDEGVILSVIFDQKISRSFLLILDASTFKEIARSTLPHRIPLGLHGQYYGEIFTQ